jgi:hypothetical protein
MTPESKRLSASALNSRQETTDGKPKQSYVDW